MPDAHPRQGLPGEVFQRNVAALAAPSPLNKGGIINPENYKSFVVNIRPKKWKEKFWIGQIDNYVDAQFVAEGVFYYIGHPPCHLKNANFKFPPLECRDRGISTLLINREMCFAYAASIAKGNGFKAQRSNFIKKVKELVLQEVKSDGVQNHLLQFRDASGSAAKPVEGVAGNDDEVDEEDEEDEEDVLAGHPTPMEVDEHTGQAAHVAQLVLSSQSGPKAVDRNVEGGTVHIPSFGMDGPRFTLQSDLARVDDFSWDVKAYLDSFQDSDLEDSLSSLNSADKQDFCGAAGDPKKSSFDPTQCPSAFENFEANFFAMEGAGVDFVNW